MMIELTRDFAEGFDEGRLPREIQARLVELRACGNIESVTVKAFDPDAGALCILVPAENVADGSGWAMATEPHLLLIPAARYAH